MKKLGLLISSLCFVFFLNGQILFDQTATVVTGGIASQDFETASNLYDCHAVDEFDVPQGTSWTIDSILILGQYSAGAVTTTGLRLTFFEDSSGAPGPIYSQYEFPSDMDKNGDGDVLIKFDCTITLEEGRYWMGAQAMKTFGGGGGQWYWTRDSLGTAAEFQWQNSGAGFGTPCTTFAPLSQCVPGIPHNGTAFTIYGCEGGPDLNPIGNDTSFCEGPSLTLDPGNGGLSNPQFSWSNGATTQSITVDSAGEYRVSVTDPNTNCYSVECIGIDVLETPQSNISDTSICQGESFTFDAFAGNASYLWQDSTTGAFYTASTQGYYVVEITSLVNGCVGVDSAFLTVNQGTNPTITGEPSTQACEGDTLIFTTAETFQTYSWSTGSDSNAIEVTNSGMYYLTVTDQEGCESNDSVEFITIPPPTTDIVIDTVPPFFGIRLSADEGFESYKWSTGGTQRRILATNTGTYSVTITDQFGCTGVAEIFVEVTGINEVQKQYGLKVFPNPATDKINVSFELAVSSNASYLIRDLSGRQIMSEAIRSSNQSIDVSNLSQGMYILEVRIGDARGSIPIAIE